MKSAILFAAASLLYAGNSKGDEREFQSNGFEGLYATIVTSEVLANTPIWSNDDDNPPLSAKRAREIATRKMAVMTKGLEHFNWRLTSLSLERIGDGWFWLVTYTSPPTDTARALPIRIVVLMDGSVVEPKKIPVPKPTAVPSA